MDSKSFIIWLKGFSEACHEFHPTPKQWDRLKEVLNEVEDYNDYEDLDEDKEAWDDWYHTPNPISNIPLSGSINTSGSLGTMNTHASMVWNDKMAAWHYTNYPDGFGYYTNSSAESKNKKQQLND